MRLVISAMFNGLGVLALFLAPIALLGAGFAAGVVLVQGVGNPVARFAALLVAIIGTIAYFGWALIVVAYTHRAGDRRWVGWFTLVGTALLCVPAGYSHLRGGFGAAGHRAGVDRGHELLVPTAAAPLPHRRAGPGYGVR